MVLIAAAFVPRERSKARPIIRSSYTQQAAAEPPVGLPVGEELRILAGASRKYVDHAGKLWSPDSYFSGGGAVPSAVQRIWRTQDPIIYRSSRQGDFGYNIPLKAGTYELRLHFAETFYGPESAGGGGEGSRIMTVLVNGQPLLHDFDVLRRFRRRPHGRGQSVYRCLAGHRRPTASQLFSGAGRQRDAVGDRDPARNSRTNPPGTPGRP